MKVIVQIPDDLAQRLTAAGGDLSRRALEALAVEEYKRDRLTKAELQRLLGIETSFQLDAFLKAHDVWIEYTMDDAERERKSLERVLDLAPGEKMTTELPVLHLGRMGALHRRDIYDDVG
jgi:hypothetical protein